MDPFYMHCSCMPSAMFQVRTSNINIMACTTKMQRGHRVPTFPAPPAFGGVHRNLISAWRGKGKSIKILCSVAMKQPPSQVHAAFEQLLASQDCVRSSLFGQRCKMFQREGHKPLEGGETSLGRRKEAGVTEGNPVFMEAW